jgi:hypothetical protein
MTEGSAEAANGVYMTSNNDSATLEVPAIDDRNPNGINSTDGFDELFSGEAEEWPTQGATKGYRAPWPVTVLVALLLLVGGLAIGAYLQRSHPSTSAAAGAGAARFGGGAFAAGAGAAGAAGATTGASSASSGVTTGTVTDIVGQTLYVTNSSGALVAVKVNSSTTIDRNASSSLSTLEPGDTVTVQGPTAKNGSVTAASVSATQKGVTTTGGFGGGGFAGFGGGAAGAGAAGGTGAKTGG